LELRVLGAKLVDRVDHLRVLLPPCDDLLDGIRKVGGVDHWDAGVRLAAREQRKRHREGLEQLSHRFSP
jgi:hypothetical protein